MCFGRQVSYHQTRASGAHLTFKYQSSAEGKNQQQPAQLSDTCQVVPGLCLGNLRVKVMREVDF